MIEKMILRGAIIGGLVLLFLDFSRILSRPGVFIGAVIYSAAVLGAEFYLVSKIVRKDAKGEQR